MKILPKDEEMLRLKRELNFLLWTGDVPEIPACFSFMVPSVVALDKAKMNMQCVAHMVVSAAVFTRRQFAVTTRGGVALVLDPDGKDPKDDYLNQIGRHWWDVLGWIRSG